MLPAQQFQAALLLLLIILSAKLSKGQLSNVAS
jgi:hypothetical protein